MKLVYLVLLISLFPTTSIASPSLDARTQEILERRVCQYLRAGATFKEVLQAIFYDVEANLDLSELRSGHGMGAELSEILADEIIKGQTRKIVANAITIKCSEFYPHQGK